ncbi:MAG TPA: hypothetical protein VIZ28_16655 [Chitinophagaceae bacterium]
MRFLSFIFLLATITVRSQNMTKVISESYSSGKPKVIRYFDTPVDAKDSIKIYNLIGTRYLNIPVSFMVYGYYEDGKVQYKGQYKKGFAEGLWETFYETGIMNSRSYYKNGLLCDSLKCWYSSGMVSRLVVEVDSSKRLWHNIDYYEAGNKRMECFQIQLPEKIIAQGSYKEWHENKQLGFEAEVKDGKTVGKWRVWDENGKLIKESEESIELN